MDGSNEDGEDIEEEEDGDQISEVDRAKAVAEAFGKSSNSKSSSMEVDEVAAAMKELDMDNYDEEDDGTFTSFIWCRADFCRIVSLPFFVVVVVLDLGIELFSSGLGDLYYPSNELDPYLKDAAVRLYSLFLLQLMMVQSFVYGI